ncbi:hypothetical protein [Nocardioides alkalitolerans]|uniref:hypothetical protein n=1 Tax=Nocardioides alkalitolerans TaxID=281714 RepID=UPI0003F73845|nr:hypothetical protein [Nocardioides alkalitolerans]
MGLFGNGQARQVEQLQRRVRELEGLVDELSRRLGVDPAVVQAEAGMVDGVKVSAEVRALAAKDRKIEAIKLLRAESGLGLADAKRVVDQL